MSDDDEKLREILIPPSGVTVHDVLFDEAVELIIRWAREGTGGYVSTPNVDHLVRARRDPAFRELVMGARLRVPDGMGLIYSSRLAGRPIREPVHGRSAARGDRASHRRPIRPPSQ